MILVHKMVPGPKGHQPGVVGGCGDGDGAGAAHVRVAQLVRQQLQLICCETVVIPQHLVVGGPAGSLQRWGWRVTSLGFRKQAGF